MANNSPIEQCNRLLDTASKLLARLPETNSYLANISALQLRLKQPCVLAVAGKVKAGKSSFLNALIGMDLAKVGELETTATINRFCYGEPDNPERPVKVVWDNGMETNETSAFMDSLQGHDEATLRKAQGIAYLEYRIPNDLLREITLVDTPGTDAVVGKDGQAHQKVTETFFKLRKKHREQTVECAESADAVIYLVGAVPTMSAKKFLDDFKDSSTGASSLNAIGVLSKVDIDNTLLKNRHEQADYVARALREQLNTVVPVSAGLFMELEAHKQDFLYWAPTIKSIPPDAFEFLMEQQDMFLTDEMDILEDLYEGSNTKPLPLDVRRRMKGDTQWSIFRTIATTIYNAASAEQALATLYDMANIDAVKVIIKEQFFNRSKIIRCYRVLNALLRICQQIKFSTFHQLRADSHNFQDWKNFVRYVTPYAPNKKTAESLLNYLSKHGMNSNEIDQFEDDFRTKLLIPVEQAIEDLRQYDADYQMLKLLQASKDSWSEDHYAELCSLFGLYGSYESQTGKEWERQQYWRNKAELFSEERKRTIAEYAATKYGQY